MGGNKSSFHMGDEINGSGKTTYLRASQHNTYEPLPQDNVKLTKDCSKSAPKAIGAMPAVTNPSLGGSGSVGKALGGLAGAGQVILSKNSKTGNCETKVKVRKTQLTTGSYLHTSQDNSRSSKSMAQFISETAGNSLN